jgi:rhodanese-related sulfurtransferase
MSMVRELMDRFGRRAVRRAGTETLAAETLQQWLAERREIQLLDIRDPAAFRQGHLPGARRVLLERLGEELSELDRGLATVVY